MPLKMRLYRSENDYQRMRYFLRQVFLLNDRRLLSWSVVRLDYWRWHGIYNLGHGKLEENVYLWETPEGELVAFLNREGPGQAFLQMHPAFKTRDLEQQMIIQAEESLQVPSRRGGNGLWIWTNTNDAARIDLLQKQGFTQVTEAVEHQWRRSLALPIPDKIVAKGYSVRSLGGASELSARSWASFRAFHSEEADDNYQDDWSWYLNIQSAPLYQPDLDLVAVDAAGDVAAFTTIWYDEVTHCGEFEPVGTIPEHQRRGLASALMVEGMQRLKSLGATQCMVTGGSPHANGLYASVLGSTYDMYQAWEKRWTD